MSYQLPDKSLLGYMVLSATKTPFFPFMPAGLEVNQHIEGSVAGSVVCHASESHPFFYPQRGRNYTLNSVQNYANEADMSAIMNGFANIHDKSDADIDTNFHSNLESSLYDKVQENSLLSIEQHRPFGITALFSKGIDLYMYGLYSEEQNLLVWTNLASFEDLLQREYGNRLWLYRFRPRRDVTTVLFAKRLCSRWYRWSQQANLKNPAARYPALEKSLFSRTQFQSREVDYP
jgi:hypothetical protein